MWRLHHGGTYLVATTAMETSSSSSWLGDFVVVVVVGGGDGQHCQHWAVMVISVDNWWGNCIPDVGNTIVVIVMGGDEQL